MQKRTWNGSTAEWINERHYTKDEIDAKLDVINELLSLSGGGGSVSSLEVTVEKQPTADVGYVATYVVKQGGTALSPKINIDHDASKEATANMSQSISTDTGSTTKYPSVKAIEDYAQPKGNYLTTHQDISGKEDTSNRVTSSNGWNSTTSDSKYPTEKLVKSSLDGKVNVNQGTTNNGKFLKVSSGNVTCESVTIPTVPTIADNLTTDDATQVLSAKQGKVLNENKISKVANSTELLLASGSTVAQSTFATSGHNHDTTYAPLVHSHSAYVNPTIADNLTTNDATQVLSAKQGKVLAGLIGDAISYINQ